MLVCQDHAGVDEGSRGELRPGLLGGRLEGEVGEGRGGRVGGYGGEVEVWAGAEDLGYY